MENETLSFNLCVDCKWIMEEPENHPLCRHPRALSRVTGKPVFRCDVLRHRVGGDWKDCAYFVVKFNDGITDHEG